MSKRDHSRAASRSRSIVRLLSIATALAIAATSAAAGAQAPAMGRITGTVNDSATGRPLGAVQVSVAGTRFGTTTDDEGRFTINGVAVGTHTIEARRLGY